MSCNSHLLIYVFIEEEEEVMEIEEKVEEIEDEDNKEAVLDKDEEEEVSNPMFHMQLKNRNDGWDMLYNKDQKENVDLDFEEKDDTENSAKDDTIDNTTVRNKKGISLIAGPGFKSLKKLPLRNNRRDLKRFPSSRSGKALQIRRKKLSSREDFLHRKNIPSNHNHHDSKSKPFKTNNFFSPVKEHLCTTATSTNIEACSGNELTVKELVPSNKELSFTWKGSSVLNSNTSLSTSDDPSSLIKDFFGTSEVLGSRNVISNASTDSSSKITTIETKKENSYENIELASGTKGLSFTKEDLTVNFKNPLASAKEIPGSDKKFSGSMKKDDKLDNIMEKFRFIIFKLRFVFIV